MRRIALGVLCLVAFAIPFEYAMAFSTLGTLARVLGIVAAGIGVAAVVIDGRIRQLTPLLWPVAAFILWNGVSLFWTIDPELSEVRVLTYAQLLVMVWLLWEFAATPGARQLVMQSYVLGGYVSIAATLASFVAGAARQSGRYAAFAFDPNDLGLTLALGIPMAWQLMHRQTARTLRWLNGAYLPAAIVTVLLTASRGALVATAVASSIVLWSLARLGARAKLSGLLLIAVTAAGVYAITPESSWRRLAKGRDELATGDISYRLVIWRAGAREFLAHPTVGVGAGAFRIAVEPALGRAWAAHNTYLAILVEQGLVGFAIFLTMCAVLIWRARAMPPWERRLCLVLSFTWAAGVGSLTWEHRKPTWFVLGLVICHAGVAWPAAARQARRLEVARA